MNSAAVVIVSLFVGALFVVILAGLATLIYLHIQFKRTVTEVVQKFAQATAEIRGEIDSARTSFGGIRADVKAALASHENRVGDVLATHARRFDETIGKVNGTALEAACRHIMAASAKIVQVSDNLQRLLYPVDAEEIPQPVAVPRVPLGPEDFAPEETIYVAQTAAARIDGLAEAVDNLEHFSDNVPV